MNTPTPSARDANGGDAPEGTRGPDDDFFCLKYQVWYRMVDCAYRGRNRTFAGCVDCFQGFLNIKSLEKGIAPPRLQAAGAALEPAPAAPGHLLPFASPARQPGRTAVESAAEERGDSLRIGAPLIDDGKDA